MAQSKKLDRLSEPDIRRLLNAGSIESELDFERAMLADRFLRLYEQNQPELGATRKALRTLIANFETKRWSDETLVTQAQLEENDAAEIQAEKEYEFIKRRRKLILSRLKELHLKQNDLALLLNHNKSYTSELLNGIRPFSSNDLILIHRLFKIPLEDLFITILSHEIIVRLDVAIDKISASNPKAKLLRSTLVDSPPATVHQPGPYVEKIKVRKPASTKYPVAEITLSNK